MHLMRTRMEPKYHTLFQAVILFLTILALSKHSANAAMVPELLSGSEHWRFRAAH